MANEPISPAAYARHRGIRPPSVAKAIKRGRLRDSLVKVGGRTMIVDVAAADAEWTKRSNYARRPDLESSLATARPAFDESWPEVDAQITDRLAVTLTPYPEELRWVLGLVLATGPRDEDWVELELLPETARALATALTDTAMLATERGVIRAESTWRSEQRP